MGPSCDAGPLSLSQGDVLAVQGAVLPFGRDQDASLRATKQSS